MIRAIFGVWSIFSAGYITAIVIDFAGWGNFRDSLNLGNFGNALMVTWLVGIGVYFMLKIEGGDTE